MNKEKLTDQEIAKVFAMYWGNVSFQNGMGGTSILSLMDCSYIGNGLLAAKLLLTPLSKITDEHAVEIARILDVPGDCVERHKNHIAVYDRYNDNANEINTLRLHFIDNYELLHLDEMGRTYEFDLTRCSCVHQFLISKGYAVPLFFELNHPANFHTAIDLSLAIEHHLPIKN